MTFAVISVILHSITVAVRRENVKLIISNISGIPIYEQIKQQIKSAIMSGELNEY